MKEIITALIIWLGANSDFNVNMDVPTVVFLPQDQMELQYFGESHTDDHSELHAFYDTQKNIIVLPDTWDRRKPWDLSVLLHATARACTLRAGPEQHGVQLYAGDGTGVMAPSTEVPNGSSRRGVELR